MGVNNFKQKYLTRTQVNFLQGLAKMRGFDSASLAERNRFARSTIIANMNGDRQSPLVRWAIATVLKEPQEHLFPVSIQDREGG
jgi:hypothetical protein